MKVDLGTIDVNDRWRRAIRHYYGKTGLATRAEVRSFLLALVSADMDNVEADLLQALKDGDVRPGKWQKDEVSDG